MNEKYKKFIPLFIVLGLALLGAGIYIVVNRVGMAVVGNKASGFWMGLWQGAVIILAFVASWFDKDVVLYQAGNSGFWYNLGYIFGLCVALGGGAKASNKKKC